MTEKTMTPKDAAAVLEADQRKRAQACGDAIAAVLKEHDCDLIATPFITADGRINAQVQVIAK